MSHELLLAALRQAQQPLCDDCLYGPAGYVSRQGARAAGISLADRKLISRETGICSSCGGYKAVNWIPRASGVKPLM